MSPENSPDYDHRERIKTTLAPRLIAEPLKSKLEKELQGRREAPAGAQPQAVQYEVIIELNLDRPGGRSKARESVIESLKALFGRDAETALARNEPDSTHPYVFANLTADQINALISEDGKNAQDLGRKGEISNPAAEATVAPQSDPATAAATPQGRPVSYRRLRSIFRIWQSQKVRPLTTVSIRTVKANAAHNSFRALGEGIVWAILDSGIDASHPHFQTNKNLDLPSPLAGCSRSFLAGGIPWDHDAFGHGTHVAGIIAGECNLGMVPHAAIESTDEHGDGEFHLQPVDGIRGMAPLAKLLTLRVLDDNGDGDETALIQAIEYIQKLNDYGRHVVVHGVNISAGFPSHPTWYACGQTPLCVEVDRLVKSGVAVVAAAGNSGHIVTFVDQNDTTEAGQLLSVNDPGNADLAITVGSTHRESPHTYGISYFSSKGPTSDGRQKPDLVAPGEKIISAASAQKVAASALPGLNGGKYDYIEDTGTSMAAPHVSGILAAFLSVKREFVGQPEQVKQIAMQSAMDLRRDKRLQGAGLIDLMKMIQSV
jgi:serine protease AprX